MNSQAQVENEINLPRKKNNNWCNLSQFLIVISFDIDIPILQNIFHYLAWETYIYDFQLSLSIKSKYIHLIWYEQNVPS
jgi:hypothetical protein